MACAGCTARRARAAKWFAIAADRARSLINPMRKAEADANSTEATSTVNPSDAPAPDA